MKKNLLKIGLIILVIIIGMPKFVYADSVDPVTDIRDMRKDSSIYVSIYSISNNFSIVNFINDIKIVKQNKRK